MLASRTNIKASIDMTYIVAVVITIPEIEIKLINLINLIQNSPVNL